MTDLKKNEEVLMLKGKTVVLGVTGGIAAYKIANLASMLVKQHANVRVIMTQNATNFINPLVFETLTQHKCLIDTFDRNFEYSVEHVTLAKWADIVMIAPATANVIGKLAHGIADDMLTTTVMACAECKKILAPAMNTRMYENPVVQDNLKLLEHYGYEVIQPASGHLACGDNGAGKMPEAETLYEYIYRDTAYEKDLTGKKILVTAGPTRETIDPVRFISNRSTGKMGFALAKNAMERGADVTLVSGPVELKDVPFVKMVHVESARQMFEAVTKEAETADIIVKAAAVADYRPAVVADEKIKKKDGDMSIALERTDDIIGTLGKTKRDNLFLCGFSMETEHMLENSKAKLEKKNLDMIIANNVKVKGAGFGTDTNVVTLITKDEIKELPIMSKEDVADEIFNNILANRKGIV